MANNIYLQLDRLFRRSKLYQVLVRHIKVITHGNVLLGKRETLFHSSRQMQESKKQAELISVTYPPAVVKIILFS
jgi:hypothetical protein